MTDKTEASRALIRSSMARLNVNVSSIAASLRKPQTVINIWLRQGNMEQLNDIALYLAKHEMAMVKLDAEVRQLSKRVESGQLAILR